jgi:hypothetical protein
MGNTFSYSKNVDDSSHEKNTKALNTSNLIEYIDMVATNYVLKQNMIDMIRFTDKEYYDNMVILTSYILKQKLSSLDVGILKNRVMDGYSNDKMNKDQENNNNNQIFFSNANELKEITIQNEKKKQKALLIISKFYMKVMTLFSAIVATIDPQYVYEDEDGTKKYFGLRDFNSFKKIDKETKHLKISQLDNPIGLVKRRLTILKNKLGENNNSDQHVIINPGELFCEKPKENAEKDMSKLDREIGIKELDALYFDVYDHESNSWNQRSKKMQAKYDEDLVKFHQIFTGKKKKPDHVKSFADIEMLKFHELTRCLNRDYYEDLVVSKNDHLFKKYMEKIYMIQNITKSYKKKMLSILKRIFVPFESNHETSFIISPSLTMESLLKHQDETKDCINQIYMNCERLFIEALLLYEKMYENQHGILTENQIESTKQSMVENNVLDANRLNNTLETPLPETPPETPLNNEDEKKNDSVSVPAPLPLPVPVPAPVPVSEDATVQPPQQPAPVTTPDVSLVANTESQPMPVAMNSVADEPATQPETQEVSEIPTQPIPESESQPPSVIELSETPPSEETQQNSELPIPPQEIPELPTPTAPPQENSESIPTQEIPESPIPTAPPQETSISPIPNAPPQENSESIPTQEIPESPAPNAPPQQIPMPSQIPTNRVVLNNSNPPPQPQQLPQPQENQSDNGLKTPDLPLQGGFMEQIRNSIIDVLNNR